MLYCYTYTTRAHKHKAETHTETPTLFSARLERGRVLMRVLFCCSLLPA